MRLLGVSSVMELVSIIAVFKSLECIGIGDQKAGLQVERTNMSCKRLAPQRET